MAKFRKKPVVIEAHQFDGENGESLEAWSDGMVTYEAVDDIFVRTPEGRMEISLFDWVIKGVNGEFYPCKPDIFEKTYDPVDE